MERFKSSYFYFEIYLLCFTETVCCESEDGKAGSLCCEKNGCSVPSGTHDLLSENYRRHQRMKNYLKEVCKYFK
ncbi:MEG-2 (ESP15) family [Schistosoma mansoni]|uniref:MEG-2 (ESP15) family n=1 Tax=Schistosoma mansoni TaxID=6183 RepID=C4QPR6_SCHMA|nr:MEG-2 (ESP15) family [Schistosoma mansoni]|eukprot:XP_018644486.1 MEG-2 (ESP15) family [Schistosoma mansoni]